MQQLTASLAAAQQQISVLQAASQAASQALHDSPHAHLSNPDEGTDNQSAADIDPSETEEEPAKDATPADLTSRPVSRMSVPVLHNARAVTSAVDKSTQPAQSSLPANGDFVRISQLQNQAKIDSTKISQLERHSENLRKTLSAKDAQYAQLLHQHQALQAMATEASQEGDQQEADLQEQLLVIRQLQQQLLTAQQAFAKAADAAAGPGSRPSATPAAVAASPAVHSTAVSTEAPTVQQAAKPQGKTPLVTGNSPQRLKRSVSASTSLPASVSAASSTITIASQPAAVTKADAVSLGAHGTLEQTSVVSPSLSMPQGSVDNLLAGQPDLDDLDDYDSRSKMRLLLPQLSGLASDSDSASHGSSDSDSDTGSITQGDAGKQSSEHPQPVKTASSMGSAILVSSGKVTDIAQTSEPSSETLVTAVPTSRRSVAELQKVLLANPVAGPPLGPVNPLLTTVIVCAPCLVLCRFLTEGAA